MKFGYDGADLSKLIAHYKILNEKIYIEFLDKSFIQLPYNDENIKKIEDEMISQAEYRNERMPLDDIDAYQMKLINLTTVEFCIMFGLSLLSSIDDSDFGTYFYGGGVSLVTGMILSSLLFFHESAKKNKELEKYSIYLKIKENIEKNMENPNLYNKVKARELLSINSLDNFSLKEIKQIQTNLKSIEKYQSFFEGPIIDGNEKVKRK